MKIIKGEGAAKQGARVACQLRRRTHISSISSPTSRPALRRSTWLWFCSLSTKRRCWLSVATVSSMVHSRKTVSVLSASMLMSTTTTIKLRPMRKTFMTVLRTSSWMYLERIVPAPGQ